MSNIYIPVSIGELLDKITILEIKKEKIKVSKKIININNELELLKNISLTINLNSLHDTLKELKHINSELWDIEEAKRKKEKLKLFDLEFIELARSVYIKNDKRAEIKKTINLITKSLIIEEKSYNE